MYRHSWSKWLKRKNSQKTIVIDLTPLLSGGENGGAKILTLELIPYLATLAPKVQFVLLTSDKNHQEFAYLDAHNISRTCVQNISFDSNHQLLKLLKADLLFCPFNATTYASPQIPTVCIIYDLQYMYYPQFFSAEDKARRHQFLTEICQKSTRLICISDYTKQTLINNFPDTVHKAERIYISLHKRFLPVTAERKQKVLQKFQLASEEYLIYPANFWRHKNHETLFSAFSKYKKQCTAQSLKLICPGVLNEHASYLKEILKNEQLIDDIILPGYITHEELSILMQSCFAMIYPSLYEGFGIPIAEAMVNDKPVICSRTTSLPEVAGEAALYCDPNNPEEMANLILQLQTDNALQKELILKGSKHISHLGDITHMAQQYLDVFDAARMPIQSHNILYGVYTDGWCSANLEIVYTNKSSSAYFELVMNAPEWITSKILVIKIKQGFLSKKYYLKRGETLLIKYPIIKKEGLITINISPTFNLKTIGSSQDERNLTCLLKSCRLISEFNTFNLFMSQEPTYE
jgi:glycosyltransferase involved in cell wall biosynthesis